MDEAQRQAMLLAAQAAISASKTATGEVKAITLGLLRESAHFPESVRWHFAFTEHRSGTVEVRRN